VSLSRHGLIVAAILVSTLAAGAVLVGPRLSAPAQRAVVFGALLAGLNAVLAHLLVVRTRGRAPAVFVRLVIGGMAGRMALVLGAVAVAVAVLQLPGLPLVLSLLGYFAAFLALEIVSLHAVTATPGLDGAR